MKDKEKVKKSKYHNQHGIITVFVTLIMVPVVVITGILVDIARVKLYSSQAVMVADSYGDAILSEYDNLLKQLYGLFAVTQNEDGLKALETFAEYSKYSFNPNADQKGLSGFMPYKDADVELLYEKVENASLSNNNVLMTQINDFMKYRVVEEVLKETGILNSLDEFDKMDADMDAVDARNDITKEGTDILEEIDQYYQCLKKLAHYPSYITSKQVFFEAYSRILRQIVNPAPGEDMTEYEKYEKYINYLRNKDEIDAAHQYFNGNGEGEREEKSAAELARLVELDEQYVDQETYLRDLESHIQATEMLVKPSEEDNIINFNTADVVIDDLGISAGKLNNGLSQLQAKIGVLRSKLQNCREELKSQIEAEVKDLEEIMDKAGEFQRVYELIRDRNHNGTIENNESNKSVMEEEVAKLDAAKARILSVTAQDVLDGEVELGKSEWAKTVRLVWDDFRDDSQSREFYEWLEKLCETGNGGKGDKDAGDEQVENADSSKNNAEESLKEDDKPREDVRDISEELAAQLQSSAASGGEVPDLMDYLSGGLSFDALGEAGTNVISKFFLATYDFGMFSSRVTGIRPENQAGGGSSPGEGGSGTYTEQSLTGMEISKEINYLYGAELEYLFGGHNSSKDNQNEVRNIICGIRLTTNFISSYLIDEVNSTISSIATAAASFGGPAAPLVRVVVSGALRAAFAMLETASDWDSLMQRKGVVFLKTKFRALEGPDQLAGLLGGLAEDSGTSGEAGDSGGKIELTYENYLYILLVLLVDENTLLFRTANLITLNVNQAGNREDTLKILSFKMSNTVTAVKSTCKVKMDFVVVPDHFIELFLKGNDAEKTVEVMEDHYFGYSIIRGY